MCILRLFHFYGNFCNLALLVPVFAAGWTSEGIAVTSGGRLHCQKIFHLYAGARADVNAWKTVIGRCFTDADAAAIKSLALPPVGTGTSFT